MTTMKTSGLTGSALNWAVAQCRLIDGVFTDDENLGSEPGVEGLPFFNICGGAVWLWGHGRIQRGTFNVATGKPWVLHGPGGAYSPLTNWGDMGPVINEADIDIFNTGTCLGFKAVRVPDHSHPEAYFQQYGPDRLIAAARCYVASILGEEVDIPGELT